MRVTVIFLSFGALAASLACTPAETPPPSGTRPAAVDPCDAVNTLTEAEEAEGWTLLFDGRTMDGWHGYNGGDLRAWSIDDCALSTEGTEDNYGTDKEVDIVTDGEYTDFELTLDWKTTKGGNSGLMYGIVEDAKYETAWTTGPEYQLIDDEGYPNESYTEELEEWQKAGADYGMHPAGDNKRLMPVGEWNTSRLVVDGPHVEHWLNGEKVVEFERWTDEWRQLKESSTWKDYPDKSLARTGPVAIQDHGSKMWFRNIKIREIEDDPTAE